MRDLTILNSNKKQKIHHRSVWIYLSVIFIIGFPIVIPYIASVYIASVLFLLFICIGYAQGWNIMSGFTGYVNFGYSLFIGIAGYVSVILVIDLGVWWPIAWFLSGVSASIVAFVLGIIMLRLRGSYFAIGMLALLLGIQLLFTSKYLAPITRGGYGFPFIVPVSFNVMYYSAYLIALLSTFISYKIITSRFGAKLLAIREDEEAAGSIGINVTMNKIIAFVISAFFGGLVGSIHIAFQNYIEPHSAFNIHWTIVPIVMVLLGGPGTVWGPVIGALILTFVEEFLWSHFTQAYMMIYGFVMVVLVLLVPGGIIEWLKNRGKLPKIRTI